MGYISWLLGEACMAVIEKAVEIATLLLLLLLQLDLRLLPLLHLPCLFTFPEVTIIAVINE